MVDEVLPKEVELTDLTTSTVDGTGVFDKLMSSARQHIELEFTKNRIKGPEYSQVYLGALTQVLQTSVSFLLNKDDAYQKALLTQAQIKQTEATIRQTEAQILMVQAQVETTKLQAQLVQLEIDRAGLTKDLLEAQVGKLKAETINVGKQGLLLDNELLVSAKQLLKLDQDILQSKAQVLLVTAQVSKVNAEVISQAKQDLLIVENTKKITIEATNAIQEGKNLVAQECILKAQYDLTLANVIQAGVQTALVQQKTATEKAQISATGVDDNSVIGKQKLLYGAQTNGFTRDAEQKAAKLMTDTWNVRRTTDDGTVADGTNLLNDATIGRTISKLLAGIGA